MSEIRVPCRARQSHACAKFEGVFFHPDRVERVFRGWSRKIRDDTAPPDSAEMAFDAN